MFFHSFHSLLEKTKTTKVKNVRIQIYFPKKLRVMFANRIFQNSNSIRYLIKKPCGVFFKSCVLFCFVFLITFVKEQSPNNVSFISHHSLAFVVLTIQKCLILLCLSKCQSFMKSFIFPTACDLFHLTYIVIMYIIFQLCQYIISPLKVEMTY